MSLKKKLNNKPSFSLSFHRIKSSYNFKLNKVTLKFFFSLGQHIGHEFLSLNFFMHNFLFCIHKKICILSLDKVLLTFYSMKNIFKSNFKNILIISYDSNFLQFIKFKLNSSFFFAFGVWAGGTLKNWAKFNSFYSSSNVNIEQPDLGLTFSFLENFYSISEFFKMGLPLLCLSDTNANPNSISYPIMSNDDNFHLSAFWLKVFVWHIYTYSSK